MTISSTVATPAVLPWWETSVFQKGEGSKWWAAIVASSWVVRMITRGYWLQLASISPRFSVVLHSLAVGESACVLQEEISSPLNGFYSRYFPVIKNWGEPVCAQQMSHQTTLLAWMSKKRCLSWIRWWYLHGVFIAGGPIYLRQIVHQPIKLA